MTELGLDAVHVRVKVLKGWKSLPVNSVGVIEAERIGSELEKNFLSLSPSKE